MGIMCAVYIWAWVMFCWLPLVRIVARMGG